MNFDGTRQIAAPASTTPVFHDIAAGLCRQLATQSPAQVGSLLGVSANLAKLNAERYKSFRAAAAKGTAKPVPGSLEYGMPVK